MSTQSANHAPADPAAIGWAGGGTPTVAVVLVALLGAVYSYASIYTAAAEVFGRWLAIGFPLLVDALIAACSLYYVGSVRKGRPQHGYRWTAHAGISATIGLNALAARSWAEVPWHVVAPAVWGVLIELRAREALRDHRADYGLPVDRIPARLWLTAPAPSVRVWLWMARNGIGSHVAARTSRGRYLAAREALRIAVPGRPGRRVRRVVSRQLRMGSLPAAAVITACGLHTRRDDDGGTGPAAVLRAALLSALDGDRTAARTIGKPALGSGAGGRGEGAPKGMAKGRGRTRGRDGKGTPEERTRTDEELIADLRAWTLILADPPSSRQVRARYGIGDERARRLLRHLGHGITGSRLAAVTTGTGEGTDDVA